MIKTEHRYTGTLRVETPRRDYGFFLDVKDASGKPISLTEGEGVFVRISEAKRTLGNDKNLLLGLDGKRLAFGVRDSDMYPGKIEACEICDPTANHHLPI